MDRAERIGFGVAVVGHAAMLAALILLARPSHEAPQSKAFEVSFVDDVGLVSAAPEPTPLPAAAATLQSAPAPRAAAPAPQP